MHIVSIGGTNFLPVFQPPPQCQAASVLMSQVGEILTVLPLFPEHP